MKIKTKWNHFCFKKISVIYKNAVQCKNVWFYASLTIYEMHISTYHISQEYKCTYNPWPYKECSYWFLYFFYFIVGSLIFIKFLKKIFNFITNLLYIICQKHALRIPPLCFYLWNKDDMFHDNHSNICQCIVFVLLFVFVNLMLKYCNS